MALDDGTLASDIQAVLDGPPESDDDFSQGLTDAIIKYLSAVQIDFPAAPGAGPAPPYVDPSYAAGAAAHAGLAGIPGQSGAPPTVPADSQSAALKSGIDASISASREAAAVSWDAADSAYSAALVAIGALWSSGGYTMSGAATAPALVGFGDTWAQQLDNTADIAADLADRVHAATTGAVFTGIVVIPPFLPVPHVSNYS